MLDVISTEPLNLSIMPDHTQPGAVMKKSEEEIDREARSLISQYKDRAALVAVAELNRSIDRRDWDGRDGWARVVRRIHELSSV
jgi:hypothetical protein